MGEKLQGKYENSTYKDIPSIDELLPEYHEKFGDIRYEMIRKMSIDDHDVAWAQYDVSIERDGEVHHAIGRELVCACTFAEGIGWLQEDGGQVSGGYVGYENKCLPRQAAQHLRKLELKEEYEQRFGNPWGMGVPDEYLPPIIMDMIEKDKAGEWLSEGSSGAHDYGGHFYVQTLVEMLGFNDYKSTWKIIGKMMADKQIQMTGNIIQEYYAPPEPRWTEYGRYSDEGWTCVAEMPDHEHMPQEWRLTLIAQDGRVVAENIPGPRLMHEPIYGVDVNDDIAVKTAMKQAVDQAIWDPMSMS